MRFIFALLVIFGVACAFTSAVPELRFGNSLNGRTPWQTCSTIGPDPVCVAHCKFLKLPGGYCSAAICRCR